MAVPVFRITEEDLELFHDSLSRCMRSTRLFDEFYDRFLGSSPEVAALFAQADMAVQKRMLRASLYVCLSAARNEAAAYGQLRRMSERHQARGIRHEYYDLWLEHLVGAARACDRAFTGRIEVAWRTVLQPGIEIMRQKVQQG